MSLERNFSEHGVELSNVIQVGIDENHLEEAWVYSAYGAERVVYLDTLPPKILHAKLHLNDHPHQDATLSAVAVKDGMLVKVFAEYASFHVWTETLDSVLMKKRINPLKVNYLNVNIDNLDAKRVIESADMLIRLGEVRYISMKNSLWSDILIFHGFKETYKGFYIR